MTNFILIILSYCTLSQQVGGMISSMAAWWQRGTQWSMFEGRGTVGLFQMISSIKLQNLGSWCLNSIPTATQQRDGRALWQRDGRALWQREMVAMRFSHSYFLPSHYLLTLFHAQLFKASIFSLFSCFLCRALCPF